MRGQRRSMAVLSLLAFCGATVATQNARPQVTVFENARLITGTTAAPIERAAFIVEGDSITVVGQAGAVGVPSGATRVDLSGKTVVPAFVDIHNHLGWTDHKTNLATKTTFTRALVQDHLQRYAYYGVAATLSMGLDRWDADEDFPYQLRQQVTPNAARFLTVGRGIAATPMAGPTADYRLGVPYGAQTEAEGRARVRALADRGVEMIKIWVDDRLGAVPKLDVPVYTAILDEAHRRNMRVVAHIFALDDGKRLLRAGVDGFGHGVRDRDVDDEFVALVKSHPRTWVGPNLPARTLTAAEAAAEIDWVSDTLPPSRVQAMRRELAARPATLPPNELFAVQCRNLKRVHDAGMIIGVGTDANGDIGWGFHEELADMVSCGLTPAEAIVAGTSTSAAILKLDRLGSLARGKSADFVVLNANPLDDIHNTRNIVSVYLRGAAVDRESLRRGFVSEPR